MPITPGVPESYGPEADETDRPLSKRAAADLAFTKLMAEKGDLAFTKILAEREAHGDDRDLEVQRAEFLSLLISDGDFDDEEVHAAEEEPEYIVMEAAADSGAGDNVASKADAPGYKVRPSAASRRGGRFVGAGGHGMDNQGEMTLLMEAPNGTEKDTPVEALFQVADVVRPLFSVSKICDRGNNTMTFDREKAVVRNPRGKILCVFKRKGNLYIAQMKVRNPRHSSFARPGK